MRISALTARQSKLIRKAREQKRAVNSGNNQFIGKNRGGKTSKIHAIVDALGNPVHFILTGGQVHDSRAAIDLLSGVDIAGSSILADKAYGAKEIRDFITEHNAVYTIPPKESYPKPWKCDYHIYKERHLVESFFNRLKAFRRVATRFDKLAASFLSFTLLRFAFC